MSETLQAPPPKYVQIRDYVKSGILRGQWRAGDQLPTCRELTAQFDVTPMTVWKALDELGRENLVRRVRGKGSFVAEPRAATETDLLGLIMRPEGDSFGLIYRSLLTQLGARGHHPLATDIGDNDVPEALRQELLQRFLDRPFDCLIADGRTFLPFAALRDWQRPGRQLNFLLRCETLLDFPRANRILLDWQAVGRLAAEHLLADGGQRLVLVTFAYPAAAAPSLGPQCQHHWPVIRGIEATLADAGLPREALRIVLDAEAAQPDQALRQALRAGYDRVFCLGDFRAARVYAAAAAEGLRIGADVRVCGCFDTPWATTLQPALSSLRIQEERLAATAVEAVSEAWQGEEALIRPILKARDSSQGGAP